VFILGTVISGAISVFSAINTTDANLRRNMQPIVTIEVDMLGWNEYWMAWLDNSDFDWANFTWESLDIDINDSSTLPPDERPRLQNLTATDVRAIGALDYVAYFDYTISTNLRSFELDQYIPTNDWGFEDGELRWFDVRGTSNENLVQIEYGTLDLVQGTQFSPEDLIPGQESSVAIISEAFAQTNNLTIGSTFSLYSVVMYPDEYGFTDGWGVVNEADIYAQIGMEFEVIGLFEIPIEPNADLNRLDNPRLLQINGIYLPNWVIEDIEIQTAAARSAVWDSDSVTMDLPFWAWELQSTPSETSVVPLFVLDDPLDIEAFITAAGALLPAHHYFVDLSNEFADISSSMAVMQNIANWILYVACGAMLLVLNLLISLFLRDRQHEIGIYLALGEKKVKIISQVLIEIVTTSLVGITLAVFTGNFVSGIISQNLLENELVALYQQAQADDTFGGGAWGGFEQIGITTTTMTPEAMLEAFDVSLSLPTIGLLYVACLGVAILSTIMPMLYIVRLSPKEVLL